MHTLNLKNRTGTIRLDYGHALILGHKPDNLKLEEVGDKQEKERLDIQSLGLFDNSTPNYTTYYPDVTAEDLAPKDADFIYPVFRMLSETILSKGVPIDFGKKNVLKNSMNMMLGQTINVDHETALGNAIGVVTEVKWQNSYKTDKGNTVPAGFNGTLKIDGKSNPRIARGIMMSPPSIHSNSVTVRFAWEPSHTFENENEFFQKLGTYDKDGDLIRLVVSDIKQYSETSLVGHGADPYAQKIGNDGKIVNPDYAGTVYSFSQDVQEVDHQYVDYKDVATLSFKANTIPSNLKTNNTNKNNQSMFKIEELIAEAEKHFGLNEGTITKENFIEQFSTAMGGFVPKADLDAAQLELVTANDSLGTLTTDKETLNADKIRLEGELETANANARSGEEVLAEQEEAKRLFKLIKGENVDEAILNSITKMDFASAHSFKKQYEVEANAKFPDTCQDCQSLNISKASAKKADPDNTGGHKQVSNSEAMETLREKGRGSKQSIALGYNKSDKNK
jgi:hypothetical protein